MVLFRPSARAVCGRQPNIVAAFEMRVGAEECVATVCLPFSMIFPKLQGDRNDPFNGEGAARPVTDFREADNIDVAWVAIAD